MAKNGCRNFNHGRRDPPVRVCPMCGEVVNSRIPVKHCGEQDHAKKRKNRNTYCTDCGERLIRS